MQQNHILHLCHMKGYKAHITFHQETWYLACLVFMLLALKKATAKPYILHYDIRVKNLYIIIYVLLHCYYTERFHKVTHNYAASFSIKTRFYEVNNICYFKN